jgi:hypothetical protein
MKSYNDLLDPTIDPTIPNKAHFVAGGKHAGLKEDLDDLTKGLSGSPENQRKKFFERILALAKKRDLLFGDVHGLALARHPEWNKDEVLTPTEFAPKLPTRTERDKAQAEADKKRAQIEQEKQQKALQASTGVDLIEGFARQAHANRMVRIQRIQATTGKSFADAWDETEPGKLTLEQAEKLDSPRTATLEPKTVQADDRLPPGTYLNHGADVGLTCPLFGN